MLKLTGQYLHVVEFVKSHKLHNLVLMDQLTKESSQGTQLKGKKSTIHLKQSSGFNFSIPYKHNSLNWLQYFKQSHQLNWLNWLNSKSSEENLTAQIEQFILNC